MYNADLSHTNDTNKLAALTYGSEMAFELANIHEIYKKDDRLKKHDVDNLSSWLNTQPHLPQLTELQVMIFLHSCYYDPEAAKLTIVEYFTFKSNSPLLQFATATEAIIRDNLSKTLAMMLPKRTPNDCSVMFFRLLDTRPESYTCQEHSKIIIMLILLQCYQYGPANGLVFVADMQGCTFSHVFRLSVATVKHLVYFLEEATPIRLKRIHFINVNPVTRHFLALARPFMKKDILGALKFHPQYTETLYEFVPKECLPEEYGGGLQSFQQLNDDSVENLVKYLEFFKWHDSQRIAERGKGESGFFSSIQKFFK